MSKKTAEDGLSQDEDSVMLGTSTSGGLMKQSLEPLGLVDLSWQLNLKERLRTN